MEKILSELQRIAATCGNQCDVKQSNVNTETFFQIYVYTDETKQLAMFCISLAATTAEHGEIRLYVYAITRSTGNSLRRRTSDYWMPQCEEINKEISKLTTKNHILPNKVSNVITETIQRTIDLMGVAALAREGDEELEGWERRMLKNMDNRGLVYENDNKFFISKNKLVEVGCNTVGGYIVTPTTSDKSLSSQTWSKAYEGIQILEKYKKDKLEAEQYYYNLMRDELAKI